MDKTKNTIGAILLLVVILIFVVGGFFFMNYMTNNHNVDVKKDSKNKTKEDVRINTSKDYVYYENEEEFLEEAEIEKKDVVLNFKKQEELNNTLNKETEDLFKKVIYIKDNKIPDGTEYQENEKGIYSVEYRDYRDITYGDYISLLVLDFKYDVINSSVINNIKSYVVNKNTGELYTTEDLLKEFDVTEKEIIEKVTKRLNDSQVLEGDKSIINVDETIKSIKNNDYSKGVKALGINKNGKLTLYFIVKTSEINYNDSVELN